MVAVGKEHFALDAPMVVDEVGIVEIHAPPLALWRKAAEEQHPCVLGQERAQRVIFNPCIAAGNVLGVEVARGNAVRSFRLC